MINIKQLKDKIKFNNLSVQTKASIAYMFANCVSKGINIITVPLFTRLMSTSEMGIGTTYTSWYSILYAIVTLSLCSGSLNIAMVEYKDRRNEYLSACLTLSTISGLIFAFFCFGFSKTISRYTFLESPLIWLLSISLIINPALDYWYARQRYEYKYKSTVLVTISVALLSAIVSVISVLMFQNNESVSLGVVRIVSQGLMTISIALYIYIYIIVKGRVFFDLAIWKYALSLSIPLIFHTLAKSVLDVSDRIMISALCGQSEAGIYGTVYTLSMMSLLIWNAINSSIIPTTFEMLERREYKSLNKMLVTVLLVFGGVAIVATLLAPEILMIFTTDEYYDAVYLIPALSAGIYFTALYNIYGNLLLFKKKTVNIMLATMFTAVFNIMLNYYFIEIYGYIAAAYTTMASFILLAICQCLMVRVVYKEKVTNDNIYFGVSVVVSIVCLSCNLIYPFRYLRYLIIVVLVLIAILNKNKIFKLIRTL